MKQKVNATLDILNAPDIHRKYVVVRADRNSMGVLALWYFGQYDSKDTADDVASGLGNGLVIEVM